MTVAASQSIFGFGPQSAKGTLATTWYRHPAVRVNFGPQQVVNQFPPELNGYFEPTGAYKAMAFGAGVTEMLPRLKEVIGWLLYSGIGQLSQTDTDVPESGMYRHRFAPPDSATDMKWLSLRRYIPGSSATAELGEVIKDARVVGLQFAVTPAAPVGLTATFVGREPLLMQEIDTGDSYAWSWSNTMETYPSVPIGNQGSLSIGADTPPATDMTITIANAFTAPNEEMVLCSPYPDDFIMQFQTFSVAWTYKWQDPDLYKAILTGSNTADGSGYIAWSSTPHTTTFDFYVTSPGNVSGKSSPYRIHFYAPELVWQAAGPPALIGGGWLRQAFTGIAQKQTSVATFYVEIDNEVSTYSWPS